jgi:hypothetical protein
MARFLPLWADEPQEAAAINSVKLLASAQVAIVRPSPSVIDLDLRDAGLRLFNAHARGCPTCAVRDASRRFLNGAGERARHGLFKFATFGHHASGTQRERWRIRMGEDVAAAKHQGRRLRNFRRDPVQKRPIYGFGRRRKSVHALTENADPTKL